MNKHNRLNAIIYLALLCLQRAQNALVSSQKMLHSSLKMWKQNKQKQNSQKNKFLYTVCNGELTSPDLYKIPKNGLPPSVWSKE